MMSVRANVASWEATGAAVEAVAMRESERSVLEMKANIETNV